MTCFCHIKRLNGLERTIAEGTVPSKRDDLAADQNIMESLNMSLPGRKLALYHGIQGSSERDNHLERTCHNMQDLSRLHKHTHESTAVEAGTE